MGQAPGVTQEFLDAEQYSAASIKAYESVYGRDFVSPGGESMARELVRRLELEPGSRVLDVGSGLGGSAFLMAREFGLRVDGIDLSHNMIALARQQCDAHGLTELVTFEQGDCLTLNRPNRYQAIYSRDVFLHIQDKARLFDVLLDSLAGGGRLLFTDYSCGDRPWHPDFADYVQSRAYCLHTLPEYVALVEAAGFVGVTAEDLTERFGCILESDLARIEAVDVSGEVRANLSAGWRAKLDRVITGDQRWGMLEAYRPGSGSSS